MESGSDWCILRTSGRHTLRLAEILGRDGFEVWTPIERKVVRVPRMNVKRPVALPIMPSYVFAKSCHLIDLIQLSAMPLKPRFDARLVACPDFSIMHHGDRIPIIADDQLQALRRIEVKRQPKKRADITFPRGVDVKVKVEGGSFAGMKGRVERSDHVSTLVCFDDRLTIRISTSLLSLDELGLGSPSRGEAARKAA